MTLSTSTVVRREPMLIAPVGDHAACVRLTDGMTTVLSSEEVSILAQVSDFAPLDEHVYQICERLLLAYLKRLGTILPIPRQVKRAALAALSPHRATELFVRGRTGVELTRLITRLHEKGLIISEQSLRDTLSAHSVASNESTRITHICIPTFNRPMSLHRCLETFASNLCAHNRRDTRVVVVDDSSSESAQLSNRDIINTRAAQYCVRIRHIDWRHRSQLVAYLANATSVEPEVLQFGLMPHDGLPRYGATRNVAMLLTAGEYTLQTDDDTVCEFAGSVLPEQPLVISASSDPCDTWFYHDHDSTLKHNEVSGTVDVLSLHERYLGKSVAILWRDYPGTASFADLDDDALTSLRSGAGRIALTTTGVLGDCGLHSTVAFRFAARPETTKRLLRELGTDIATAPREVLRIAAGPTISRGNYFQAMSCGVDNTRLVPPFFPVGRNEDNMFAVMCLSVDRETWIAHLPWAIHHASEPYRSYPVSDARALSELRLTDILTLCLKSLSLPPVKCAATTTRCAGQQLVTVSKLSPREFRSFIRTQFVKSRGALLELLQRRVSDLMYSDPVLAKEVEDCASTVRKAVSTSICLDPVDTPPYVKGEHRLDYARGLIGLYGKLLVAWEELLSVAGGMADKLALATCMNREE